MKKRIKSCLLVVVIVVLSVFYAHIDKNTYIYDRHADTDTFYSTGILKKGEQITQTFVAQEDTIDGINIKVSCTGNVADVDLQYALLDEELNKVESGTVSARKLENNKFNKISFSKISDTQGKKYTLVLQEENSDDLNGISFYVGDDVSKEQQLTIRGSEVEGTLITRTISHGFDLESFVVLLGMISFIVMFLKVLYKYFK